MAVWWISLLETGFRSFLDWNTLMGSLRLEGITKSLKASILVSFNIYNGLSKELLSLPWENFGEQALKGKESNILSYGINKSFFQKERKGLPNNLPIEN